MKNQTPNPSACRTNTIVIENSSFSFSFSFSSSPLCPPFSLVITFSPSPSLSSPSLRAHLNNHLRNSSTTQRLATHKLILPRRRNRIKARRDQQHNSSGNETRSNNDERDPLHNRHDEVDCSAHIVCAELPDEVVEFGRGGADAQEEGDFYEEDYECACSVGGSLVVIRLGRSRK
jgi:hypothetical protein